MHLKRIKNSCKRGVRRYTCDAASQLLGEYDGAGGALYETVYLDEQPVAVLKPAISTSGFKAYYLYADHLNTPRLITDNAAGTANKKVWQWDSDPFGITPPNENPAAAGVFTYNPRFPGQVYDKETGLHYNYFRDYNPGTGRYVQSDPIGLAGGINTYGYVGGNPVSFTDPLGHNAVIEGALTGGRVAGWPGAIAGGLAGLGLGSAIMNACRPTDQDREERICDKEYQDDLLFCAGMASVKGLKKGSKVYGATYQQCVARAEAKYVACYQDAGKGH